MAIFNVVIVYERIVSFGFNRHESEITNVFSNMEQIIEHKTPTKNWSAQGRFTHAGDLPKTDDILSRCVNVSVGVVDGGLGSAFGINIHSSDDDIKRVASHFIEVCESI